MRIPNHIVLAALVVFFAVSTALAGNSDPVRNQDPAAGQNTIPLDPEDLSVKPQLYTNENEDFQIIFPGGCAKLVTRANEPDLFGGEQWDDIVQVTYVFCDRFQVKGEGCSVKATYNLHGEDGGMAGPPNVISRVENVLKQFQAKVVRREAVSRKYDNGILVEGVEILAKPDVGPGEVWIQGLLVMGDIYILTAWNKDGGLWEDPDYATFFSSFQPWVD